MLCGFGNSMQKGKRSDFGNGWLVIFKIFIDSVYIPTIVEKKNKKKKLDFVQTSGKVVYCIIICIKYNSSSYLYYK